jgi:hypothetical protein
MRPELLANSTYGGSIDERRDLLYVFNEQPMEERLVAVVQLLQIQVLFDGTLLRPHVVQNIVDLRL